MTMMFVLIVSGFLGLLTGVTCELKSLSTSAMPTLDPFIGNITISPSVKVNYTVEVTTSGPAVLDSIMVFRARVFIEPNGTLPTERLRFLWLNSADHTEDYTGGRHVSELHKTFDQNMSGNFVMMVVVSSAYHTGDILSFSSIAFKLTKRLNGNLKVKQHLEYQRINTTFAIDRPIDFQLNITDRFRKSETPQYSYFWYNGSQLIHMTFSPNYQQNFSQPDVLHLQAIASAVFLSSSQSTRTSPASPHIPDKTGSFMKKLHFKESLSRCNFSRLDSTIDDQSLKLGNTLLLNVTCAGSTPSAVCWNVTQQNLTLNETCRPPGGHFANTTQHNVSVTISSTGWNTVHLAVYNDVSFQVLSQDYYVYDADSVNIPALVLPIVFIVLGGVIAVVGASYIVRLRRKVHVEVADFDFDPTISVRSTRSWSSIVPAVKQFFQRSRHRATSSPFNHFSTSSPPCGLYDTL